VPRIQQDGFARFSDYGQMQQRDQSESEVEALERQLALATAMRGGGEGTQAGRVFVAQSPLNVLASAMQGYQVGKLNKKLSAAQERALAARTALEAEKIAYSRGRDTKNDERMARQDDESTLERAAQFEQADKADAAAAEQLQYSRGRDVKADEGKVLSRREQLSDAAQKRQQALDDEVSRRQFERSKPATSQPTEGERKSATLATRLRAGLRQLDVFEETNPGAAKPGLLERGLTSLGAESAANMSRSSMRQQADAAQRDVIDALLTASTGAAYTKQQFDDTRISFFPQPGDTADTVKAKKERLRTAVDAIEQQAGRAAPAIDQALGSKPAANDGWKVTRVK